MSSDAFLRGFFCFQNAMGNSTRELWMDNGRNFVGAKSQFDKSLAMVDVGYSQNISVDQLVVCDFHPPSSSCPCPSIVLLLFVFIIHSFDIYLKNARIIALLQPSDNYL